MRRSASTEVAGRDGALGRRRRRRARADARPPPGRAAATTSPLIEGAPELGGLASAWQIAVPGTDGARRDHHVGPALPRHPAVRPAHAGAGGRGRPRRRAPLGRDEDRLLRHRRRAALGLQHVEFLQLPGLNPLDKLRLGGTIVYGSKIRDGKRMERIPVDAVAAALVRRAHLRALLEAAAAGQAGRRLPARRRRRSSGPRSSGSTPPGAAA